MVVENYLLLIVSGLALGVIFFYFLCESLIRLERRKAEGRSRRYKSAEEGKQGDGIFLRKASAPPATGAAAAVGGGYMLLPLSRSHQNLDSNEKSDKPDNKGHKPEEDPRSPEAWQRQDSGNSYAERKEDPWICKNGAVTLGASTTPAAVTTTGTDTGVTETVAIVTTAAVLGATAGTEIAAEVTKPAFSTAGFWEAREAAKHGENSGGGGGYFGGGGQDSTGGGYNSSNSGGYDSGGGGFGNDGTPAYAWGGGTDILTEKPSGWGQSSEI